MELSPPDWIVELANQAATTLHAVDVLAPLGCHFYQNKAIDQWEVTIFPGATETVGGRYDGQFSGSKFAVDIQALEALFTSVDRVSWQALSLGGDDQLGPHLSVEGMHNDHSVWLRILAGAPERFDTSRFMVIAEQRLVDLW